jgi:uncharacterized membrane protein YbhN (UPF0104 family)
LPERPKRYLSRKVREGLLSLDALRHGADRYRLISLTILLWGLGILTNWLALASFRLTLPLSASILMLVALQAGISLASTPGWVGVFEYIVILSLGFYGVGRSQALGCALALHFVVYVPGMLGGIISMGILGLFGTGRNLGSQAGPDVGGG